MVIYVAVVPLNRSWPYRILYTYWIKFLFSRNSSIFFYKESLKVFVEGLKKKNNNLGTD